VSVRQSDIDFAPLRRILVIGCPGAGKSTLASTLSAKLGLPAVHLDQIFWRQGWVLHDLATVDARLAIACGEPAWIMDGNGMRTLAQRVPRAEAIIWLDLPRSVCIARVIWRTLRHFGRTRPDMTPGCPERFDLEFLGYIWSFRSKELPRILAVLEADGALSRLVRLTSSREVSKFLATFA
jgi:adenylate kinase family enzyme